MKLNSLVIVILMIILAAGAIAQEVKNPLVGHWVCQDDGTKVQIRANGTLTINNDEFIYKVKGSVINLFSEEGAVAIPFALDGDTLAVEVNGREMEYIRVKPGVVVGKGGTSGSAAGNEAMAMMLVGKCVICPTSPEPTRICRAAVLFLTPTVLMNTRPSRRQAAIMAGPLHSHTTPDVGPQQGVH